MNQPPEHQEREDARREDARLADVHWLAVLIGALSSAGLLGLVGGTLLMSHYTWRPLVFLVIAPLWVGVYLAKTNSRRSRPKIKRDPSRRKQWDELETMCRVQVLLMTVLTLWTALIWFEIRPAEQGAAPVMAALSLTAGIVQTLIAKSMKALNVRWIALPKKARPRHDADPLYRFPLWALGMFFWFLVFVFGAGYAVGANSVDLPTVPQAFDLLRGRGGEGEADEVEPGPHEDEEATAPPIATPSPTESPDETSTPTAAPSPTAPDCGADTEATLQAEAEDPDVGLEMSHDYRHYGYGEVGCLTSAGVAQEGAISYGILVGGDSDPSMVVGTEDHGASVIFDHAYERTLRYIRNHTLRYVTDRIDVGAGDFYLYLLKAGRCALSAREYKGDPYVDLPPIVSGLVSELADERDKFPVPQGIEPSGTQLRYSIEFRGAVPSQDELETVVLEGGTASWTDAFGERHEVTEPGGCRNHLELERLAGDVPPP